MSNRNGRTPLMIACMECADRPREALSIAKALVRAGAKVNAKTVSSRNTPLHIAAALSSEETLKLVALLVSLKDGHGNCAADINAKNATGATPLWNACNAGCKDAVQLLLTAGAEVTPKNNGSTPLMCAITSDREACVHCLVNYFCECENEILATSSFDPVNAQMRKSGASALVLAAESNRLDCLEHLLSLPVYMLDVDTTTLGGDDALTIASREGHFGIVKILLRRGCASEKSIDRARRIAESKQHHLISRLLCNVPSLESFDEERRKRLAERKRAERVWYDDDTTPFPRKRGRSWVFRLLQALSLG